MVCKGLAQLKTGATQTRPCASPAWYFIDPKKVNGNRYTLKCFRRSVYLSHYYDVIHDVVGS